MAREKGGRDQSLSNHFNHPFVMSNAAWTRGKAISASFRSADLSGCISAPVRGFINAMGGGGCVIWKNSLYPYIMLHTVRFPEFDSRSPSSALPSQQIILTMHNNLPKLTTLFVLDVVPTLSCPSVVRLAWAHTSVWAEDHTKLGYRRRFKVSRLEFISLLKKTGVMERDQAQHDSTAGGCVRLRFVFFCF